MWVLDGKPKAFRTVRRQSRQSNLSASTKESHGLEFALTVKARLVIGKQALSQRGCPVRLLNRNGLGLLFFSFLLRFFLRLVQSLFEGALALAQ